MITADSRISALYYPTIALLHELGIGVHLLGYRYLAVAIPCYACNSEQSLSKEIYPYVAHCFGCVDWHPVERSIRSAIGDAWEHRNPAVWEQYFPNQKKAPTNKQFMAVLAERLR